MDFHPRYRDSVKTYEYRILNRRFQIPTERLYSYFYHYKLDEKKMREATSYLIGRHDFASFCGAGAQVKSTVRTIRSVEVERFGIRRRFESAERDFSIIWFESSREP